VKPKEESVAKEEDRRTREGLSFLFSRGYSGFLSISVFPTFSVRLFLQQCEGMISIE